MDLATKEPEVVLSSEEQQSHDDSDVEDLTEEEIKTILREAAQRIRTKAKAENNSALGKYNALKLPTPGANAVSKGYIRTAGDIARVDSGRLLDNSSRELSNKIRKVEDPILVRQNKEKEKKATAGSKWYNLPRTELTPELKRDLQLLKMRNVLDPHRHYKKDNSRDSVPEFSQVGTIIEGPTDFFSGRVANRDRKKTMVDEILAAEKETGRFKRKYDEIQVAKSSGKKAHWKALKERRKAGKAFKR